MTNDSDEIAAPGMRVAYITSRFPKISETFILYEMEEVSKLGVSVALYALVREHPAVIHSEARRWLPVASFSPGLGRRLIAAQIHWLRTAPRSYLRTWGGALAMNLRSPAFLVRALFIVPAAAFFAQRMVESGTNHIHAHYATHPALAAWVAARLTGIPYSFTAHAHDVYVDATGLQRKANDAAFVRAISEFNKEHILAIAPNAHVVIVRTGTDPTVFAPATRNANRRPTLVAVGSLEPYKGHSYFLEACRILAEDGLDFVCQIVGDGAERPALTRLIQRAGLNERVALLGAMTREEVREVLARGDVFVLPSISLPSGKMEGLPVVLMEAMAMELPVVATRLSGIPELVDDGRNGLLVPQRDPAALAAAIQRLASDAHLRRRLATAGRHTVIESFNLSVSARQLVALFRDSTADA